MTFSQTPLYQKFVNSRLLRSVIAGGKFLKANLQSFAERREELMGQSYTYAEHPALQRLISDHLWKSVEARTRVLTDGDSHPESPKSSDTVPLTRTVVLKQPGEDGEKGVILSTFEYNWAKLLHGIPDFRDFNEHWTVIYSTSWSPTDYQVLSEILQRTGEPIYVQACNYQEIAKLHAFHPRIRCLKTLPCDWLDPTPYQPREFAERDIDILMVSNWAPFKRHDYFFKLLRHMSGELRIVCVGQPENQHTLARIRNLKASIGATQPIEFLESIPIERVTELQCMSKISIICSQREGCCVAAAESLMAGAILAMPASAHVGPKAYINDQTGVLLHAAPELAARQLQACLSDDHRFQSQRWAIENISSQVSVQKLNSQLKADSIAASRPWRTDLATPCWRPHPTLISTSDRRSLAPAYGELHRIYPRVFPKDLIEFSWK